MLKDLTGKGFWKLTEKERIWIKATVKKCVDKIPLKVIEVFSWAGFPIIMAYIIGRRIKMMWSEKEDYPFEDEDKGGEDIQDPPTLKTKKVF